MTQIDRKALRVLKWRGRGWTWERIAQKVGFKDRRFAQMCARRALDRGLAPSAREQGLTAGTK